MVYPARCWPWSSDTCDHASEKCTRARGSWYSCWSRDNLQTRSQPTSSLYCWAMQASYWIGSWLPALDGAVRPVMSGAQFGFRREHLTITVLLSWSWRRSPTVGGRLLTETQRSFYEPSKGRCTEAHVMRCGTGTGSGAHSVEYRLRLGVER